VRSASAGYWPIAARSKNATTGSSSLRCAGHASASRSALSEGELDGLTGYLDGNPRLPFRYLSIHGPSKGRTMPEAKLASSLARLADRAQAIVMHPDTIEDPENYRILGRKLVLENMDARKSTGRTPDELAPWFSALPDAGFCFDIAHAWSLDATMTLGGELLDAFRTRLRHVHVSSMGPSLHHVSLTDADEELFMPILYRCLDVPWDPHDANAARLTGGLGMSAPLQQLSHRLGKELEHGLRAMLFETDSLPKLVREFGIF
jgi:hypothetical protein